MDIQTQLQCAREMLAALGSTGQSLDVAKLAAERQVRALEEAQRAAAFAPNATMLRDLFYPFAMSAADGDIKYRARKGDRVMAFRGEHEYSPFTITTSDARQHQVDGERMAASASSASSEPTEIRLVGRTLVGYLLPRRLGRGCVVTSTFEYQSLREEQQAQDERDAVVAKTLLFLTDSANDVHERAEALAAQGDYPAAYGALSAFVAAIVRVRRHDPDGRPMPEADF